MRLPFFPAAEAENIPAASAGGFCRLAGQFARRDTTRPAPPGRAAAKRSGGAPADPARRQLRRASAQLLIALVTGGAGAPVWAEGVDRAAHRHPVQVIRPDLPAFSIEEYQVTPRAEFSLEARVLSAATYESGREADLSPVDLALGWGPMADDRVLDRIRISQGDRCYFYSWSEAPPIPRSEIVEHSSNMHLIPASDEIRTALKAVKAGQVVRLRGYLVRVEAPDGWAWNSSLSRSDWGDGACEVVWVEDVDVKPADAGSMYVQAEPRAEEPEPAPLAR